MASETGETAIGCLGFVLIGLVIYLWTISGLLAVVVLVVGLIVLGSLLPPDSCYICGVKLKKSSYKWKLDRASRHVCPNCNRSLERKQSQAAISDLFDD